jgi:hypothetical protein
MVHWVTIVTLMAAPIEAGRKIVWATSSLDADMPLELRLTWFQHCLRACAEDSVGETLAHPTVRLWLRTRIYWPQDQLSCLIANVAPNYACSWLSRGAEIQKSIFLGAITATMNFS